MPRYFFHTADGTVECDHEGVELADRLAARNAAIQYAGELLHDEPYHLWNDAQFKIEVTDEQHSALFSVVMSMIEAPVEESDLRRTMSD